MQVSTKHKVTKATDIGKKGPGQYILETGKIDLRGRPIRKVITVTGTHDPVDQAQAELTDINNLLEPARKKGLLDAVTKYEGQMDDIPAKTYEEAMNTVVQAQQMFDSFPADIRNRFKNNPQEFLEFTNNPKNGSELIKMGLAKGNDGFTQTGALSGAPTDLNKDGKVDTIDSNADGVPDTNPPPPTE